MIRELRHLSVRLWISALAGIPASLIFLTYFGNFIPGKNSYAAAIFLFIIFLIAGYLMNQVGRRTIFKLIKEAETWERSGIYKKSEERYLKALRIYDSFLIPPWKSREIAEKLTGSIAKFFLTCSIKNPVFDSATTAFLSMAPDNADIVLLWLQRLRRRTKEPCPIDQEVLTNLAEIHCDNPEIVVLMADIFIRLDRIDFAAQKIYKKALTLSTLKSGTRTTIKERLDTEEQHLSAYAIADRVLPKDLNKGLAPEIFKSAVEHAGNFISLFFKKFIEIIIFLFKFAVLIIANFISLVKERKNVRTAVKWGISAVICIILIVLMINTFSHLFPGKMPISKGINNKIEAHIPELFTIQVAAYLKKKYGDAYVKDLKAKGLDAYLSEVQGGGKTWFLVRVSGFPDRNKAAAYGKKLKKQGYIDDFFVDNNNRRH